MKKSFLILFLSYALCGFSQTATESVYSYLLDEYLEIRSDVPAIRNIGGGTKFIVTYEGDWTNEMKGAFEYACKIWEEQIPSALPIRVTAKIGSIFSSTNPISEVIVKGENIDETGYRREFALNTRIKGVYLAEQEKGFYQFLKYANIDWVEGEDGSITYNKNRMDELSFSLDPQPTDKYDFVTIALRDIARLLGFYWGKQGEPAMQILNIQGEFLTPFEKIIAKNITESDISEAYRQTTQGTFTIEISWYNTVQLYAPNPWIKGTSLNYFIPDPTKKLTEILSYKVGKGSVIRNITDNYPAIFRDALNWTFTVAVGSGGGGGGTTLPSPTKDDGLIPYKGKLDIRSLGPKRETYSLNNNEPLLSSNDMSYEEQAEAVDFLSQYCRPYHPNLSENGKVDEEGWNVSFLKKDGTWDILYEFRYPTMVVPLNVNMANLDFKNVDNYARTYDGYLRCRISQYNKVPYFDRYVLAGRTKYYVLDFLPQKPKMQFVKVMPTTYGIVDEYSRTIKIAVNDLEGTTKIIVEQLDEGETFPQRYEIKDFKNGYFTATVDKEFLSQFTIVAYNANGSVRSETLTVDPLEPATFQINPSLHDNYIKITPDNTRLKERKLAQSYTIYKIDELSMQRNVTVDTNLNDNEIDISNLQKGFYILSICDIHNKMHSMKFFKK